MSKPIPYLNEIVSLAVMLLMVIALVAGQADARGHEVAQADIEAAAEQEYAPFRTSIRAHIDGTPLTISIDATAELDYFRLEDE